MTKPILVNFDRKSQGSEEPHVGIVGAQQAICDLPSLRTFLDGLQTLLDSLELRWSATTWVVQLRDKLRASQKYSFLKGQVFWDRMITDSLCLLKESICIDGRVWSASRHGRVHPAAGQRDLDIDLNGGPGGREGAVTCRTLTGTGKAPKRGTEMMFGEIWWTRRGDCGWRRRSALHCGGGKIFHISPSVAREGKQ